MRQGNAAESLCKARKPGGHPALPESSKRGCTLRTAPGMIRGEDMKTVWAYVAVVVGLGLAVLFHSHPAQAAPQNEVCNLLDINATPSMIALLGQETKEAYPNLSYEEIGERIATLVIADCPNHIPDLERFVQVYG